MRESETSEPVLAHTGDRTVLITVGLEDWFHVGALGDVVSRRRWDRFESRVVESTNRTLDLLDVHGARATFFTLGWLAEEQPELLRQVVARGHEIASQGHAHRTIREMTPDEFRTDVRRAKDAIEEATGKRVLGHRVPHFLGPKDLWALDVLAEEGYAYDSSVRPLLHRFGGRGGAEWRETHALTGHNGHAFHEVPISSLDGPFGLALPIAGGNFFRQLPETWVDGVVDRWFAAHDAPFVLYFHVWELDDAQPRINASRLALLRHYRNLARMPVLLDRTLARWGGTSVASFLKLEHAAVEPRARTLTLAAVPRPTEAPVTTRPPVAIVIPCYHEEQTLSYLDRTLRRLTETLSERWTPRFIFVDDGSTDGTWDTLQRLFGERSDCQFERHAQNRGVAAAILTGIKAAPVGTDIVCSMDCDCTYDPIEMATMIPMLEPGVDLVTASPYHPKGRVVNVPGWRLTLSRGASLLYRAVVGQGLHTYTSCFRVYRKSAVVDLELTEGGFLGVAELLGLLALRGGRIVEHPATLEVRLFGQSKMKTAKTIQGHLRLLSRFASAKARR